MRNKTLPKYPFRHWVMITNGIANDFLFLNGVKEFVIQWMSKIVYSLVSTKKDQKDKHGTPFSQHNASVDPIEH